MHTRLLLFVALVTSGWGGEQDGKLLLMSFKGVNQTTKSLRIITIASYFSGWTDIIPGQAIHHDLQASPIQIQTDSMVGSSEKIAIGFQTANWGAYLGFIRLIFTDPPTYLIHDCIAYGNLPVFLNLPTEVQKTWTISKTSTYWKIDCNNQEVLLYLFASSSNTKCVTQYSRDVGIVTIKSSDTASDKYRIKPADSGTLVVSTKQYNNLVLNRNLD